MIIQIKKRTLKLFGFASLLTFFLLGIIFSIFSYSFVAYGVNNMNDVDQFFSVQEAMFEHDKFKVPFIVPNKILIFDVDIDTAIERLGKKQRGLDKFEQRAKLEQARANYLAIANKMPSCVIVDGRPSAAEIFEETKKHVYGLFGLKA